MYTDVYFKTQHIFFRSTCSTRSTLCDCSFNVLLISDITQRAEAVHSSKDVETRAIL